ncbi:MAG TPA: NAD-dependent succinate-semialdehyde dehydrogenase [Polaromonas sp.]|uniref:NAD-dependent succinate-semialdehyde dehydrogenase n=1 Tax=Polaromonas sp. UBA4122 TaxID=1947074 RepID=UPI000EDE1CAC|nr:NAD-dependent succinate-semialdehyde dehydrogenase [Polaromonas sp. UBA4122]HAL38992.1 NAD-dependent succinate-semialdehyde dehydrogenase [Polaromonas sp.]
MKLENLGLYSEYGLFIDGHWRPAKEGGVREVIDPASEEVLGWLPAAGQDDLDAALLSAQQGFATWRRTSPWERAAVLRRTADLIRSRADSIAKLMSIETGKPLLQAKGEVSDSADQFDWYAGETQRIYGQTMEARVPEVRMQIRYEPVGVVAAFSAWNFPALLPSRKIAAALGAGCSVIVKPASEAAGSCMAVVQALHDAGVPAGVVNLVTGDSSFISEYLVRSPSVAKVTLTGSTGVGKRLLHLAAENVKRVTMELGGHAPVLVFEDADVAYAAEQCARFKYRNCGQVCASPSRFYVHESLYAAFCERFAAVANSLKVGHGLDPETAVGPMANKRGLDNAHRLIGDALKHGARLIAGGGRPSYVAGDKGYYLAPTALADVPEDALIMLQEPFAPVAPIAPFSSFDEAIRLANSTSYGLASYLFSSSLKTATLASEAIEAGMVGINELGIASAEMPFGGVKESGMGREGGALGIRDYLEPKFIKTRL